MALRYVAQYDRRARAWNVIDTTTDDIVRMCGGGKVGEERAKRSAGNHNTAWLRAGLDEHDILRDLEGEMT